MFVLIILLSYLLGCASTIALLLYLYTRYALYSPVTNNEQQEEEQYQAFHPLPENERAKNSAVDAVNYLFQFLFQELKDSSRLRRYIMHKLNTEFKELKNSRTGKFFLQNIVIQNFSIGKECPTFSDIQLERQERDERQLIKEFVATLNADYKDGFSVTLDITLLFGHKCQLSIKVKRIYGNLRLEFRREPFCHWLLVFQDEPFIDFEVKSFFATVESPQLAQIITQQLRRAIKRKQTWPSYKIRYQPFFPTSKQSLPTEVLTANGSNLIPGTFDIIIKHCDRLSIPLSISDKQKSSSISVFLTININEEMSADYLHINRDQWPTKDIELIRNKNKIVLKEVNYMDRTELLIDSLDSLPDGIDDIPAFKLALEEKNIFLLRIQGQDVKTLKQANRLLKQKLAVASNDGTTSSPTVNGNEDKIRIVVGMPVLHSVRIQRATELLTTPEADKQSGHTPPLSARSDGSSLTQTTVRQRPISSGVKFDKSVDSVALADKQADDEDEESENTTTTVITTTDAGTKPQDPNAAKKPKPKNSSNDITLIMMNTDLLQSFQAKPTASKKNEAFIEFNDHFDFLVGPNERYLNVCLWRKAPLECDVLNPGKKLILLGYATIALSEIVLDAHMSYKRETQMTLNFRSAYSPKPNLTATLTESESKKRMELSTHKGYDDNLAHGFVTINIKHKPEIETTLNDQEKREHFLNNGPILTDISTKLKEDERKQDQLKYINTVNEQKELPIRKPTDHIFEDKTFPIATVCASCNKKIWMKYGRQCRDCLATIHKKCEEKYNIDTICTHEPSPVKQSPTSATSEDDIKNIVHIEMPESTPTITIPPTIDEVEGNPVKHNESTVSLPNINRSTTATRLSTKAAAAFSVLDSTARRSFRAFGHKNPNQSITTTANLSPNLSTASELSISDESLHNSTKKPSTTTTPVQTSSKIANAASSAYSKLREFKSKRLPHTSEINSIRKHRVSSDTAPNENILETDIRDIIAKILSDENNDCKDLEHLLHERAVDDTALYAKANEVGPELFPELPPEERKQKLDSEISRLQHEINLQCQIREEMLHELDNTSIDDNEKRKLRVRIANIDEKVQALGALTILYCSGLKHCRAQLGTKEDTNNKAINENGNHDVDNNDDEQS